MKRAVLLLLLLLFTHDLRGQKQGRALADSLSDVLPATIRDTTRVSVLAKLARLYASINTDTGIMYGEEGLEIAKEVEWKKGAAISSNALGYNYLSKADHGKALEYFFNAVKISKEIDDMQELGINLGNIGNVYYREKKYGKAYDYYMQALAIQKQVGDKERMATNLGNIGNVYMHYFDTAAKHPAHRALNRKRTLDYIGQAIALYRETGNNEGIARNLGNLGNVYSKDDDKTQALDVYNEALGIYKELKHDMGQVAMLINIAVLYEKVATDRTGNLRLLQYSNREKTYLVNESLQLTLRALALCEKTSYMEALKVLYGNLSNLYKLKDDYRNAYEMQVLYTKITDSVNSFSNQAQITALEAKNKAEQQEKQLQIERMAVAKKRNTTWFMGIGIVLLLFVVVFVIKERKKSEQLLLNILPHKIAQRLKAKEHPIADQFSGASIMFIDIAGFTHIAAEQEPKDLVTMLNQTFTMFDIIAEKYGLEKIKTIGDSYMAVAGVPQARRDHALAAANMALEVKEVVKGYTTRNGVPINFRIGLDSGPVIAGVIGTKKFIYDLWGDAVNMASRMESTGITGEIHCTSNFKHAVLDALHGHNSYYHFAERGSIDIKGKGRMVTWLLSVKVKEPALVTA